MKREIGLTAKHPRT